MRSCCSSLPTVSFSDLAGLSAALRVLSDTNKLRILQLLQNDAEHCVCELTELLSDLSQSLLSHHLADLRDANFVISDKRGLRVYYRLTDFGSVMTNTIMSLVQETNDGGLK